MFSSESVRDFRSCNCLRLLRLRASRFSFTMVSFGLLLMLGMKLRILRLNIISAGLRSASWRGVSLCSSIALWGSPSFSDFMMMTEDSALSFFEWSIGDDVMWVIPIFMPNELNSWLANCGPPSDTIILGMPSRAKCFLRRVMTRALFWVVSRPISMKLE